MGLTSKLKSSRRYEVVTEEKAGGATYTPSHLADFVARQLARVIAPKKRKVSILDPAVGDGELLLSLLSHLDHNMQTIEVNGFDTNEVALETARRRLKDQHPDLKVNLRRGDFLEYVLGSGTARQKSLFDDGTAQQFDVIIANPPYVRTQIIGADQAQKLAAVFGLRGRVDLYHAFLIGIAQVLRPEGVMGVIVSNRFMTTKGGATLRCALREGLDLLHVWDLGDTKLFGAAVLPAIILARSRSATHPAEPVFTSIYETSGPADKSVEHPIEALELAGNVALTDGRVFEVQHGKLHSENSSSIWRIATADGDAWLQQVTAHTWSTFGGIGNIRVGVKTCADKVFIRSDWHELPADVRPDCLRRLTTHHVAGRFRAEPATKQRQILYPHVAENGKRSAIALDKHPRDRAYLEQHRKTLEARTYVVEGGRQWYEIWVPQDPALWELPKLVFRDISEKPTFWLDLDKTIVNGDCYWLVSQSRESEDLLWLAAAIANSTFIEEFYDRKFNNKLYAGRRRFITQYVEQFPLLDPAKKSTTEIIALSKKIYQTGDRRTKEALEDRLDGMVWKAFGLTKKVVG